MWLLRKEYRAQNSKSTFEIVAGLAPVFLIVNRAVLSIAGQEQSTLIEVVNPKLLILFSVAIVLVARADGTAISLLYN